MTQIREILCRHFFYNIMKILSFYLTSFGILETRVLQE